MQQSASLSVTAAPAPVIKRATPVKLTYEEVRRAAMTSVLDDFASQMRYKKLLMDLERTGGNIQVISRSSLDTTEPISKESTTRLLREHSSASWSVHFYQWSLFGLTGVLSVATAMGFYLTIYHNRMFLPLGPFGVLLTWRMWNSLEAAWEQQRYIDNALHLRESRKGNPMNLVAKRVSSKGVVEEPVEGFVGRCERMEKIVLTVYRQLYKKASKVDKDIAMRSVLTCSPKRVYDHRRGEWVGFDVAKQAGWPESRIFLDNLIRKLNGGREFYIPTVEGVNEASSNTKRKNYSKHSGGNSSSVSGSGGTTGDEGGSSLSLVNVLRQSFEETPFAVTQLNNAFAALKELAYVTDMALKHYKFGASPPELAKSLPKPHLTVIEEAEEMHHLSLTKGLSDVLERLTDEGREEGQGMVIRTSEDDVRGKEAIRPETAKTDDDDDNGGDDGKETCYGEGVQKSCCGKKNKTPFETPDKVQLLLSHPQLYDFFRHSVMIVVRNTSNESAAFLLNKPLENDEGLAMPVSATVRLNHVHPILGKHLSNHTVMVGGPVSRGSIDSSILLLHRVPDVEDAIPLSHSLWVDGNYDTLQRKLDEGVADPKDIVVICGFSGWGAQQLAGEVRSGTWLVARGSSSDPAIDDFIFALARYAGATTATAEQQTSSAAGTAAAAAAAPGRSARHRNAAAWAWAYSTLGAPYVDLARNQKPLLQEPHDK